MSNGKGRISALFEKLFSSKGVRPTKSGKQTEKEKYRKGGREMPEEKKTEKVEETKDADTEKVEETKPDETEKVEETDTEKVEEKTIEPEKEEVPVVQETTPSGNGVRVEDLVTKDDLASALSAIEAKMAALTKENEDLKQKLTEANETADKLHQKYEVGDFGGLTSKGATTNSRETGETFDSYCRNFM